jgi:hypothetical protein
MIPAFGDEGYLPCGIQTATVQEIIARFGQDSELRRLQWESLVWMIELARRAGVQRFVVNGSFVTDRLEPNDVDFVLIVGAEFPSDEAAAGDLLSGLSFQRKAAKEKTLSVVTAGVMGGP